ncbi:MFS transporter [Streptomyces prasinus]|uniref:MFS transporter n=1 Tax=Streptomyces prasinus TaxID=67345 RepID=UPI003695B638
MSALGIVVGLLLGGVLTDLLDWRWVFFINIPIGLLVLLGSRTLIAADRHPGRVGTVGAVLSSSSAPFARAWHGCRSPPDSSSVPAPPRSSC